MTMPILAVALLLVLTSLLVAVCIWADTRDQAAHDRWHADPRHVWNPSTTPEETE